MDKICATCGEEKKIEDFYRDARNPDGLRNACKKCSYWNKNRAESLSDIREKICNRCKNIKPIEVFVRDKRRTLGFGMHCLDCASTKKCKKCGEHKPLNCFNTSNRSADGYRYSCKSCDNASRRNRYYRDSEFRKSRIESSADYRYSKDTQAGRRERLLKKYGLSLQNYEEIFREQEGKCKICQKEPSERGRSVLVVDHDHKCCYLDGSCGKCVRGLLCDSCNRALGMFLDDKDILLRALEYIETSGAMHSHFG